MPEAVDLGVAQNVVCPHCDGAGKKSELWTGMMLGLPALPPKTCTTCHGTGTVRAMAFTTVKRCPSK